ncbi:Hypp7727 [Branchiostoma lanceolatum]|uniref:Hypp7727 protein n=1 Tax=Branchiostoma lanceolatum TaxID=7740 RepID=A0A8J9Z2M8_BRALA|nr:Hypp7727 [Branchiostoma lanceolatum]
MYLNQRDTRMLGSKNSLLAFAVTVLFLSVDAQSASSTPPIVTVGMTTSQRTTASSSTATVGLATVPMATSDAPSTADVGTTTPVLTPLITTMSMATSSGVSSTATEDGTTHRSTTPTNMMDTSTTRHRDTTTGSDTAAPTGGASAQSTTPALMASTSGTTFVNSLQVATKVEEWDEVELALFQAVVTYGTNRYCNQGGASCFGLGSVKISPEDVMILGTPVTSRGTTTFRFFIRRPTTSPGAVIVPLHLDDLTAIIKEVSSRLVGALADPNLTITSSASVDPIVTPSYTVTRPPDEGFEPWMIAFVVTMAVIVVIGLAMFIYSKIKARRNKQMADFEMDRNDGGGGENLSL